MTAMHDPRRNYVDNLLLAPGMGIFRMAYIKACGALNPIPLEVPVGRILWTILWETILPPTVAMVLWVATGVLALHSGNPLLRAGILLAGSYVFAALCVVRYHERFPPVFSRHPLDSATAVSDRTRLVLIVVGLTWLTPLILLALPLLLGIVLPVMVFDHLLARWGVFDPNQAADPKLKYHNAKAVWYCVAAFLLIFWFSGDASTIGSAAQIVCTMAIIVWCYWALALVLRGKRYDLARCIARKLTSEVWTQILRAEGPVALQFCLEYPLLARQDVTAADLISCCSDHRSLVDAIYEARHQLHPSTFSILWGLLVASWVTPAKDKLFPPAHPALWPELQLH